MTNRYPLILDTQDGTKIKEIPQGDSLYLSGNTIEDVGDINSVGVINATDFRINNQTIYLTEFVQLTDTPASYTGQNNKIVKVKNDGSGLEFASAQDLGVLSGTDLTLSGDIYPETDNSGEIGTTSKKWNFVRSTNVQGNLLNDSGNVVFDSATGKITGTAISGNNISIFTNDSNYITLADLSGTNTIDIKGDVVANDDSILVNSTTKVHAGNFKGNVVASDDTVIIDNTTKTITGNVNGSVSGDAILTTLIIQDNMYNDDSTLIYDSSTNTFNGNFSGNVVASDDTVIIDNTTKTITGNINGTVTGDAILTTLIIQDNMYNDDSSLIYDSSTNTFNGNFSGNVVASDDTVIIDNTTKTITGNINGSFTGDATLTTLIIQDNMYNDDSTLIYDSSTNTFNGNFVGTFSGDATDVQLSNVTIPNVKLLESILLEDSSVLIDAVNREFIGDVSYTPSTPAHWADPKPTTVAEALDKIAEILNSL